MGLGATNEASRIGRIGRILSDLIADEKLDYFEAVAIYRCLKYSEQIADVSIGNMFRPDIASLLKVETV